MVQQGCAARARCRRRQSRTYVLQGVGNAAGLRTGADLVQQGRAARVGNRAKQSRLHVFARPWGRTGLGTGSHMACESLRSGERKCEDMAGVAEFATYAAVTSKRGKCRGRHNAEIRGRAGGSKVANGWRTRVTSCRIKAALHVEQAGRASAARLQFAPAAVPALPHPLPQRTIRLTRCERGIRSIEFE